MRNRATATDILSRADIVRLVDTFYGRVRHDEILGPIFDDVARVDWATHLPRMYDFWEAVLFGGASFKGNPLAVHLAMGAQTPLTKREFGRWIMLFHAAVDDLFEGPGALDLKVRSVRIAAVMQHHLQSTAV